MSPGRAARALLVTVLLGTSAACAGAAPSSRTVTFQGYGSQQPTTRFTLAEGSVDAHWAVDIPPGEFCDFDALVWPVRPDATPPLPPVGDLSRQTYILAAASRASPGISGEQSLDRVPGGTYVVFAGGSDGCGPWTVTLTSHPR